VPRGWPRRCAVATTPLPGVTIRRTRVATATVHAAAAPWPTARRRHAGHRQRRGGHAPSPTGRPSCSSRVDDMPWPARRAQPGPERRDGTASAGSENDRKRPGQPTAVDITGGHTGRRRRGRPRSAHTRQPRGMTGRPPRTRACPRPCGGQAAAGWPPATRRRPRLATGLGGHRGGHPTVVAVATEPLDGHPVATAGLATDPDGQPRPPGGAGSSRQLATRGGHGHRGRPRGPASWSTAPPSAVRPS